MTTLINVISCFLLLLRDESLSHASLLPLRWCKTFNSCVDSKTVWVIWLTLSVITGHQPDLLFSSRFWCILLETHHCQSNKRIARYYRKSTHIHTRIFLPLVKRTDKKARERLSCVNETRSGHSPPYKAWSENESSSNNLIPYNVCIFVQVGFDGPQIVSGASVFTQTHPLQILFHTAPSITLLPQMNRIVLYDTCRLFNAQNQTPLESAGAQWKVNAAFY